MRAFNWSVFAIAIANCIVASARVIGMLGNLEAISNQCSHLEVREESPNPPVTEESMGSEPDVGWIFYHPDT